jgi:hypothetical protein
MDNLQIIRKREYGFQFSVRIWHVIDGDIVVVTDLIRDRLTAQRYSVLLETFLPGVLEDVPLTVRQRLCCRHVGTLS